MAGINLFANYVAADYKFSGPKTLKFQSFHIRPHPKLATITL